jgi:hypothetical protein
MRGGDGGGRARGRIPKDHGARLSPERTSPGASRSGAACKRASVRVQARLGRLCSIEAGPSRSGNGPASCDVPTSPVATFNAARRDSMRRRGVRALRWCDRNAGPSRPEDGRSAWNSTKGPRNRTSCFLGARRLEAWGARAFRLGKLREGEIPKALRLASTGAGSIADAACESLQPSADRGTGFHQTRKLGGKSCWLRLHPG